jgi:hypothetical protein
VTCWNKKSVSLQGGLLLEAIINTRNKHKKKLIFFPERQLIKITETSKINIHLFTWFYISQYIILWIALPVVLFVVSPIVQDIWQRFFHYHTYSVILISCRSGKKISFFLCLFLVLIMASNSSPPCKETDFLFQHVTKKQQAAIIFLKKPNFNGICAVCLSF